MDRPARIFLVAAEPSGDLLAADLARALRRIEPGVELAGVGGDAMAKEGIESSLDMSGLSVLGLFDGFKILKLVHERARQTAERADAFDADAVVLIDSWGFMLRAAWRIRERRPDIPLIKFVGPQVFATRPGRAKVLAKAVDHLLGIHPVDPDYFEPEGLATTFVGNPALERIEQGDGPGFRERHAISAKERVLLVLFGSRRSELERMYEPFAETVARLRSERPDLRPVTVISRAIRDEVRARIENDPRLEGLVAVEGDERRDAFAAAELALAVSGTVTLELASVGVPVITGYRLGWMSWALARAILMKSAYISLVNIAANEAIIPEFIQTRCTPRHLAPAAAALLDAPEARARMSARLVEQTRLMRGEGGPPSENAARKVLELAAGE